MAQRTATVASPIYIVAIVSASRLKSFWPKGLVMPKLVARQRGRIAIYGFFALVDFNT